MTTKMLTAWVIALLAQPVLAGTMGELSLGNWRGVLTLSGGPAWSDAGQMQTLALQSEIIKTYDAHGGSDVLASGEIFVGGGVR